VRGRKPKPSRQKEIEGNPGKRKRNEREPQPPHASPSFDDPPPELKNDEVAREEWRRTVPILRRIRQIRKVDRASLIALCKCWSRWIEAERKTAELGMVVKAPSGYPIVNPYLGIANKTMSQLKALWAELGLTPSSRSRLVVDLNAPGHPDDEPAETDDDRFEKLFLVKGGKANA
jgi:P27 family predicted phage terminase small subunit